MLRDVMFDECKRNVQNVAPWRWMNKKKNHPRLRRVKTGLIISDEGERALNSFRPKLQRLPAP